MRAGTHALRARRPGAAWSNGERGSISLMTVILTVPLLVLSGLVVDGCMKLRETETADAIAQEAARAGAGIVAPGPAYSAGQFRVEQQQAIVAAHEYLSDAGYKGSVSTVGLDGIRVSVTVTRSTLLLNLIGVRSMTVRGSAVADLVTGITGAGS
jgi:Flp pilus assembly protein TadG